MRSTAACNESARDPLRIARSISSERSVTWSINKCSLSDRRRLDVTPGLTCIWQVNGRADIAFPDQVRMDLDYIRRRTLRLDLKLILLTVPAVLSGRGAY